MSLRHCHHVCQILLQAPSCLDFLGQFKRKCRANPMNGVNQFVSVEVVEDGSSC